MLIRMKFLDVCRAGEAVATPAAACSRYPGARVRPKLPAGSGNPVGVQTLSGYLLRKYRAVG
ncbi:hypothetical protein NY78_1489 [Desulfovibrio sp. TomC]|nr:hypothetical protein NY78_1489 [Desulfovibrio sp. TomC]